MSSKNKIIILGILLIVLNLLSIIFFVLPKVELELDGEKNIVLNVNDEYSEPGVSAYIKTLNYKEPIYIKINNHINSSKVGKYKITYEVESKWGNKTNYRYINVVDNEKPTIKIQDKINICKINKLVTVNASAIDNYDGNITHKINYKIKDDHLIVSVTDSSENKTEIKRELNYIDSEKPTIKLNGSSIIYVNVNEEYIDEGAIANDSCDGNLSDKIVATSNVNTSIPGEYKISYTVIDSYENEISAERQVIVQDSKEFADEEYKVINGATIYLTFDDGPYKYTEDILKILKNYDVKATFFVTNQFPQYSYVIKKEYEDGHSIGIHTYSHKWTIYESIDSYMDDFRKIDEIIYNEIGVNTKIFRFPGGSSNQVSRNYKKGIMTELSKYMTNLGYKYFDWNVDSGDTNKKDSSTKSIIKNVKKSLKGDGNYIVLMHDIKKNTLEALPEIIEYALARGYSFSSLDETSPQIHFKIAN